MGIMIDLPPAMVKEAQGYAAYVGITVDRLFAECLANELKRKREARSVMDDFDALVSSTSSRRLAPYVFNRADAYEETLA